MRGSGARSPQGMYKSLGTPTVCGVVGSVYISNTIHYGIVYIILCTLLPAVSAYSRHYCL